MTRDRMLSFRLARGNAGAFNLGNVMCRGGPMGNVNDEIRCGP